QFSTSNLTQWQSGGLHPVYVEMRRLISSPVARKKLAKLLMEEIKESGVKFDGLAAVDRGGNFVADYLAYQGNWPMVSVKKEGKDHGVSDQISGIFEPGKIYLGIEDTVSTAGSLIERMEIIRERGGIVTHAFCIFDYGLKKSKENLKKAKIKLISLTDFPTVFKEAINLGDIFDKETEKEVRKWYKTPFSEKN
ncbi:MAG: phosphoribosyltransferase family protein, partial [bacterium]|nr:phosphoribosyltransferase family protein [bacterium]